MIYAVSEKQLNRVGVIFKIKNMKLVVMLAGVSMLFLASCKGETTVCDCAQGLKDMTVDYAEAAGDQAKNEALGKKYESLNTDCVAIADKMGQEEYNAAIEACN